MQPPRPSVAWLACAAAAATTTTAAAVRIASRAAHPSCPTCSDVALIEFIRTLDEAQAPADRFVIRGDLGDQALFVKVRRCGGGGLRSRQMQVVRRYN